MRNAVLSIVISCCTLSAFGQAWRDSLETARNAYRKGDYDKALRYYESAQKQAPEGVDLSDEMGQSAYKKRDFERAEKIYRQGAAEKKNPTEKARSYHNLGNSRMKKKDYQGAVEAYKEAMRNDPTNEKTRYNLSEAIRRLKQEQKKNQNENQDQNDQNKDQDQQKDQNQKNDQDKQGQNKQGNQQNGNNGRNQRKNDQSNSKGNNNGSGLPNRSVERMLDELMKSEAATKRKMGGSRGEGSSVTSGKDW